MQFGLMKNLIIVIIGALVVFFVISKVSPKKEIPVVEDGGIVVPAETKLMSEKGIEIFVDTPKESDEVMSPLILHGRAPGNWFFEASAPITLTNWDGLIIAEGYIQAEGEWMTTDYVPFHGTLDFVNTPCEADYCHRGSIIFRKDNPSGESQFDDSAEMTIKFK